MNGQDAIKTIEIGRSLIEWDYPMDYAAAFDVAIKNINAIEQIKGLLYNSVLDNEQIIEEIKRLL